MSAAILSFARRGSAKSDWTDQELAEFYRVANALAQAGREVGTDRGRTDEGDPWFIFFQPATEDVIAHFARIDGEVVADASALTAPIRARSLREVLDQVAEEYTLVLPKARRGKGLFVHPAALLAALVATALLEIEQASASRGGDGDTDADRFGKGEGARSGSGGNGSGQAVVNGSARAVSFNDAGVVGESHFNASLLMSTIAAVLSLSAHSTAVAGDDAATVAVTNVTVPDIEAVEGVTTTDGNGGGRLGFEDVQVAFGGLDGAARTDRGWAYQERRGFDDKASAGQSDNAAVNRGPEAEPSGPVSYTPAQPPGAPDVIALGGDGPSAPDSVVPIIALETDAATRQLDGQDATADKGDDRTSDAETREAETGAAGEMAKAVEDLLESGSLSGITFPTGPDGPDPRPDGEAQEDKAQSSRAKAADQLKAALSNDGDEKPTPSDLIFDGPSSGHEALRALGEFFESGAYTVQELSLGFSTSEAATTGLSGQSPLLVAYKSDAPLMDAFTFMPGVVFVDEDLVTPYTDIPEMAQFELPMTDANTVEILGFYALSDAFG